MHRIRNEAAHVLNYVLQRRKSNDYKPCGNAALFGSLFFIPVCLCVCCGQTTWWLKASKGGCQTRMKASRDHSKSFHQPAHRPWQCARPMTDRLLGWYGALRDDLRRLTAGLSTANIARQKPFCPFAMLGVVLYFP